MQVCGYPLTGAVGQRVGCCMARCGSVGIRGIRTGRFREYWTGQLVRMSSRFVTMAALVAEW
jgi:hypothetical protein